jgi:hypothetical protein
MKNNNPFTNSNFSNLRRRLRDMMLAELEGTLNPDSPDDMEMFERLFGELLSEEKIVLSRLERSRLYDDLLTDVLEASRR